MRWKRKTEGCESQQTLDAVIASNQNIILSPTSHLHSMQLRVPCRIFFFGGCPAPGVESGEALVVGMVGAEGKQPQLVGLAGAPTQMFTSDASESAQSARDLGVRFRPRGGRLFETEKRMAVKQPTLAPVTALLANALGAAIINTRESERLNVSDSLGSHG